MPSEHESEASAIRPEPNPLPSHEIARTLALAATHGPRAILVGNRAGVVEWANPAWTRITGFPLSDTIDKPITHFLEVAAIEVDLVEFVAQNFLEGRSTTIIFPFETLDRRKLMIELEVECVRNARGEIDQFVATATDVSGRAVEAAIEHAGPAADVQTALAVAPASTNATARNEDNAPRQRTPDAFSNGLTSVSVSHEIELAAEPFVRMAGARTQFDLDTRSGVISTFVNPTLLRETLHKLFVAATFSIDDSWGFVSASAGVTKIGRGFHSPVHPVVARPARLATATHAYIEIHDTQPTLADAEIHGIREGTLRADPRVRALTTASALAQAMGGELYLDSTPGCGTQALLLLPISPESVRAAD